MFHPEDDKNPAHLWPVAQVIRTTWAPLEPFLAGGVGTHFWPVAPVSRVSILPLGPGVQHPPVSSSSTRKRGSDFPSIVAPLQVGRVPPGGGDGGTGTPCRAS